jgi:hypothetical protein
MENAAIESAINLEVEGEDDRIRLFKKLRKQKDIENKQAKLRRDIEFELDIVGDIWKSGTVVKYMAYVVTILLFGLVFVVGGELFHEKPTRSKKSSNPIKKKEI